MKQETISNWTSAPRLTLNHAPANFVDLTQPDPQLLKTIKPIPRFAALLVILIGLSGLIGWAYNIDTLKRILPGLASMKANTALSFVLLGVALWRLVPLGNIAPSPPSSTQRRFAQLCAFLVTLVAGLTLLQYFFGWDLGVDQLLFRDESPIYPGRMSTISASNFLLLGSALLLLDRPFWKIWLSQWFTLLASVVSLLTLVSYIYSLAYLVHFNSYLSMALHSCIAFNLLCLGILLARPAHGWLALVHSPSAGGMVLRRLLPATITLLLLIGWLIATGERDKLYDGAVASTLFMIASFSVFTILLWSAALELHQNDLLREHDLTERRQAEKALATSEMLYHTLTDTLPQIIFTCTPDGTPDYVNQQWYSYTKTKPEQGLYGNWLRILHPDDRQRLWPIWSACIKNGASFDSELRFKSGEGEYRWHLARAVPLLDANGQVIKWVGTATDIHERRQTELAQRLLAAVSEVLAGPFDSAICLTQVAQLVVPDLADMCLVHFVENEQTIRLAAGVHRDPAKVSLIEAFAQAYPLEPQAKVGVPRVLRTRQAELHNTFLTEYTASLNPDNLNKGNVSTDKRYQAFLAQLPHQATMIVPLVARDRVLGTMTFVRAASEQPYQATDLSLAEELARRIALALENTRLYQEARTAETELKTLNTTLNQLVAERTVELERSNRELNQFAYIASHDLKAPLRAIANLAGWIQEDAFALLPDSSKEHLAKLQNRIKRMEALLNDLLTYSRAGRVEGDVKWVDSGALIRGIIEFLAPPPGFTITLDSTMPKFMTVSVPLETVLRNLIGNAIKHHNRPDGHIHIGAQEKAGLIEFMVRDDGPGIAPQYHDRIFELFQTLRPRDQVEGSGMGLAVVKKIVESRNGTLRLESEEGKGATFWFTWPISA